MINITTHSDQLFRKLQHVFNTTSTIFTQTIHRLFDICWMLLLALIILVAVPFVTDLHPQQLAHGVLTQCHQLLPSWANDPDSVTTSTSTTDLHAPTQQPSFTSTPSPLTISDWPLGQFELYHQRILPLQATEMDYRHDHNGKDSMMMSSTANNNNIGNNDVVLDFSVPLVDRVVVYFPETNTTHRNNNPLLMDAIRWAFLLNAKELVCHFLTTESSSAPQNIAAGNICNAFIASMTTDTVFGATHLHQYTAGSNDDFSPNTAQDSSHEEDDNNDHQGRLFVEQLHPLWHHRLHQLEAELGSFTRRAAAAAVESPGSSINSPKVRQGVEYPSIQEFLEHNPFGRRLIVSSPSPKKEKEKDHPDAAEDCTEQKIATVEHVLVVANKRVMPRLRLDLTKTQTSQHHRLCHHSSNKAIAMKHYFMAGSSGDYSSPTLCNVQDYTTSSPPSRGPKAASIAFANETLPSTSEAQERLDDNVVSRFTKLTRKCSSPFVEGFRVVQSIFLKNSKNDEEEIGFTRNSEPNSSSSASQQQCSKSYFAVARDTLLDMMQLVQTLWVPNIEISVSVQG